MRRLLKQVAAGTEVTVDTTTLDDFNVLAKLTGGVQAGRSTRLRRWWITADAGWGMAFRAPQGEPG